jgi:hypothetical protein
VAVLGATDVALLEGGRSIVERENQAVVDPLLRQHAANEFCLAIAAHTTCEHHVGAQCAQHRGDAGCAAQAMLSAIGPQEGYGRFLTDPLGETPDVTVQDQVANDQDPRISEPLEASNQIVLHAPGTPLPRKRAIHQASGG